MAATALSATDAAVQPAAILLSAATLLNALIVAIIHSMPCWASSIGSERPRPGRVQPGSISTLLDAYQCHVALTPAPAAKSDSKMAASLTASHYVPPRLLPAPHPAAS